MNISVKNKMLASPLSLKEEFISLDGCLYGFMQPIIITTIKVREDSDFMRLHKIIASIKEALNIKPNQVAVKDEAQLGSLINEVLDLYIAINQYIQIPVFGSPQVKSTDHFNQESNIEIQVVIPQLDQESSITTLSWIVHLISDIYATDSDTTASHREINSKIDALRNLVLQYTIPGTNSFHFLEAAHFLKIPFTRVDDQTFCYGYGYKSLYLDSTFTEKTSHIGVSLSQFKDKTSRVLRGFGLPVPDSYVTQTEDDFLLAAKKIGFPLVVKPVNQDQGRGVFANIRNQQSLKMAFKNAKKFSVSVIVEKHHTGKDYRFTVLNGKVIKVVVRHPAQVIGNGVLSIESLIDLLVAGDEKKRGGTSFKFDDETRNYIEEQGYQLNNILPKDFVLALKRKNNTSVGGSQEVIEISSINPENIDIAIRAANILKLDIAGIDLISEDVEKSWIENGAVIIEVNSKPQIGFTKTPGIFKNILRELVTNELIPIHLYIIPEDGTRPTDEFFFALSENLDCNGLAYLNKSWVNGVLTSKQVISSFQAAKTVLYDNRVKSALLVMTLRDILVHGLPANNFESVRVNKLTEKPKNPNFVDMATELVKPYLADSSKLLIADQDY
jgi:cyanophycin synthetase